MVYCTALIFKRSAIEKQESCLRCTYSMLRGILQNLRDAADKAKEHDREYIRKTEISAAFGGAANLR